jgi:hypothetical protein
MIDFYLKAPSSQELFDVLTAAGITQQATDFRFEDIEGEFVTQYVYVSDNNVEFTTNHLIEPENNHINAVLIREQQVPKQRLVEFLTDKYVVTDAYKYALDTIGVIYKPTGEMILDSESGIEFSAMAPIDGFHVNLRVLAEDFDSSSISELVIAAPNNPARGWA